MRKLSVLLALFALVSSAFAGGYITHRMSDGTILTFNRHKVVEPIGAMPADPWDANKTYRIPVILLSFADRDFKWDNPKEFYDNMFNKPGFNRGKGPGCIADYFRQQSNGLFHPQFDILGPVKLEVNHDKVSNYQAKHYNKAIEDLDAQVNFADYDWYDKGTVVAVIFIYAGYGSNETAEVAKDCIHPNTSSLYKTVDGVNIVNYSSSAELFSNNVSCGIGTILHEYYHTLGLPDLYPTQGTEYSVLDDWDLMDGGCYAGDGWCPPNLSIHERQLLKWQTPIDLTVSTGITDMPPFDNGGVAYRIVNDDYPSEYYLLENRQQVGWDLMLPGHGLLISHVDYDERIWNYNAVNGNNNSTFDRINGIPWHHRLEYFHADGLDFNYYESLYGKKNRYAADGRSIRLQHTAYPFTDSLGVVHDALTDTTIPAATLFHPRSDGSQFMGKPITQIRETDGLISFHFSDTPDAISPVHSEAIPVAIYDLQGNLLPPSTLHLPPLNNSSPRIYIVRFSDGTTKKCIR